MDYKGQKLSENIFYFLTIFFGAVAWIVGYSQNDFWVTIKGWSMGLGLSLLLCIPDWPMFNRNPVTWLDSIGQYEKSISETKTPVQESKSSKTKKEKST